MIRFAFAIIVCGLAVLTAAEENHLKKLQKNSTTFSDTASNLNHLINVQMRPKRYLAMQSFCSSTINECSSIPGVNNFCSNKYEDVDEVESFEFMDYKDKTLSPFGSKAKCKQAPIKADDNNLREFIKNEVLPEEGFWKKLLRKVWTKSEKAKIVENMPRLKNLIGKDWFKNSSSQDFVCSCETEKTYRKVCLDRVVADQGYLLTAAQFVPTDDARVLSMQIQQGKFNTTTHKVDNHTIVWKKVQSCQNHGYVNPATTMLSDFIVVKNAMLAGMRLARAGSNMYKLEVAARGYSMAAINEREVDFQLHEHLTFFSTRDVDIAKRTKTAVSGKVPVTTTRHAQIISKQGSYFQFQNTDLESDLGQRVVPYIDKQPTIPKDQATPLTGAAIVLKGVPAVQESVAIELFTNIIPGSHPMTTGL